MTPEARGLPGRPAGRLPHPLDVERRRGHRSRPWRAPAMALGHEYMVLTDHSARLTIAHGLDRERLLAQLDEVAALNEQLAPFRILTGMEVDILEDGALDLDDDLLARLDVVVASVHSKLRMERQPMTERMVLAAAIAPRRHPRPLHRAADRQAPAVGRSTPTTCSRPAPSSARRSRSTAGPSASTRPRSCSTSRCPTAASSRSTPTPTPPGSWSGSRTVVRRRRTSAVPIERVINTWPIDDAAWPGHRGRAQRPSELAASGLGRGQPSAGPARSWTAPPGLPNAGAP